MGVFITAIVVTTGPIWLLIPAWRATRASHIAKRSGWYPTFLMGVLTMVVVAYSPTVIAAMLAAVSDYAPAWFSPKSFAIPFWFTRIVLVLLSLVRIHKPPFGWIFGSSLVALLFWTLAVSFH